MSSEFKLLQLWVQENSHSLRVSAPQQEVSTQKVFIWPNMMRIFFFFTAPGGVSNLNVVPVSSTALSVSWSSPECPYGVISSYIVYYRQSDTPQTGVISSEGYTRVSDITTLQYDITGLTPFTHYAVHVQAVVMGESPLDGDVLFEDVDRTHSAVPFAPPTVPPTATPTAPPSTALVTVLIGDPRQITTGRVM